MCFKIKPINNKLTIIEFIRNKPSKFWKQFVRKEVGYIRTKTFLAVTLIVSLYCIKLTGITYDERSETLLKTSSKHKKQNSENKYNTVTYIYYC